MGVSRMLVAAILFLAFLCAFGINVNAQQQCKSEVRCETAPGAGCAPQLPDIAADCSTETNYIAICSARNNNCSPAPEDSNCNASGGLPIHFADGNTDIAGTDLQVPGLGGGLTLVRTWNSVWPPIESAWRIGLFGPNWRSTYEEQVFAGEDGYMKYSRANGCFWSFGFTGYDAMQNPTYAPVSPANESATLTQGTSAWTLTFKNGEVRTFDRISGYITSIADRNGNTTILTYDSAYRLVSVTDPALRYLYFSYSNPSTYLVTAVSSDFGLSLTYLYDGLGRLIKVIKPDNTFVSYQYDSNSFITAVLDTDGKILESHTYDPSGRGLTSSRAGGVESITVSYPQPPPFGN